MALSNGESRVARNANCECNEGDSCALCSAAAGRDCGNLGGAMSVLLGRIHTLTNEVSNLSKFITVQNTRLQNVEGRIVKASESCEDVTSSEKRKKANKRRKVRKEKVNLGMISQDSVLDNRLNVSALSNRTEQIQKQRYLSRVNCYYSEDDDSEIRSSGTSGSESETGKRRKRRRRVKSGAEVKQRPVVKTELWPHTIANEEDGEDVSSENISLARFLSCFTHIMTKECHGTEAAGRAVLLHAVSTVLECLPWAEARSFHNLVMVKVEQDRINWSTNFLALADQYLLKKVRMNLRTKASPAGINSHDSFRNASASRGPINYNVRNRFSNSNSNVNNQPLYSFVCKQWNAGKCSYGEKCRRWHTCWICAEVGKLGEPHQAVKHDGSAARSRDENQCL